MYCALYGGPDDLTHSIAMVYTDNLQSQAPGLRQRAWALLGLGQNTITCISCDLVARTIKVLLNIFMPTTFTMASRFGYAWSRRSSGH